MASYLDQKRQTQAKFRLHGQALQVELLKSNKAGGLDAQGGKTTIGSLSLHPKMITRLLSCPCRRGYEWHLHKI